MGRVGPPLPLNSHKSFNHDTDRFFFFSSISLDMPVFSVLLLFLLMYLTSPPSSPSLSLPPLSSRQSHQIADSSSPLPLFDSTLPSPSISLRLPPTSLSAYCRALMSTLARSVNYSITGRRISDSPHPPLPPCYSKNRLLRWE